MVSSLYTKLSLFIIFPLFFIWDLVSFYDPSCILLFDQPWLLKIGIQLSFTLSTLAIPIFFISERIPPLFLFRHHWPKATFINGNVIWLWRLNPRTKSISSLAHFPVLRQQIHCMKLGGVAIAWWCHGSLVPWVLRSSNLWCGWIRHLKSRKISRIIFQILTSFTLLIIKIKSRVVSKLIPAFLSIILVWRFCGKNWNCINVFCYVHILFPLLKAIDFS